MLVIDRARQSSEWSLQTSTQEQQQQEQKQQKQQPKHMSPSLELNNQKYI